jgi:Uma2 family endonuclease
MSAVTTRPQGRQTPERRNWTGEEFERLADLGFFGPEERLELIDGEIIEKRSQNNPHTTALILTEDRLRVIFREGFVVRPQVPLALGERDRPEPDLAVVAGKPRDFAASQPATAVLVVEISDSTLEFDQTQKQGVYARAGIAEYWIVSLRERLLEVYRDPVAIAGYPLGYGYRQVLRLTESDSVTPLSANGDPIAIADLLP